MAPIPLNSIFRSLPVLLGFRQTRVNHAFHNDTAAARYAPDAARLAWSRTVAFFKKNLAG